MLRKLNQYKDDLEVLIERIVYLVLNPSADTSALLKVIEKNLKNHAQLYTIGLKDLRDYLELGNTEVCPHTGIELYTTQCQKPHCIECLRAYMNIKKDNATCPCNIPMSQTDIEYLKSQRETSVSKSSSIPDIFQGLDAPLAEKKCQWKSCENLAFFLCDCKRKFYCNNHITEHMRQLNGLAHVPKPLYVSLKDRDAKRLVSLKNDIYSSFQRVTLEVIRMVSGVNREVDGIAKGFLTNFRERVTSIVDALDTILSNPLVSTFSENPIILSLTSNNREMFETLSEEIVGSLQGRSVKVDKDFLEFQVRIPSLKLLVKS